MHMGNRSVYCTLGALKCGQICSKFLMKENPAFFNLSNELSLLSVKEHTNIRIQIGSSSNGKAPVIGTKRKEGVYEATNQLSTLYFKGYTKLSRAELIEWNNRGFSTCHALIGAAVTFYLLFISVLFQDSSHVKPVIDRKSVASEAIIGFSAGYFLSDMAMILWHFPALGGKEYVLHHTLSLHSIILSLGSGKAQIYILLVLFTEITTPLVNMRWYLDVAGQKNSKIYIINGILLFFGWLVARILLFVYFFTHLYLHFDQVRTIFTVGFYSLLLVSPMMGLMNLFWFWKIIKGLKKTMCKGRHRR